MRAIKITGLILVLLLIFYTPSRAQTDSLRYLALGDSYTVGRFVSTSESFPYQLVSKLGRKNIKVSAPVLIAQNGWRTDELIKGIQASGIKPGFDIVTLLIGVNNQYQQRNISDYKREFDQLLQTAIAMANGNAKRVFVLSIPDWSETPFANGRNLEKIAKEIDNYNDVNRLTSRIAGVNYIDITSLSRAGGDDPTLVTTDHLHPSAKMYSWWADRLAPVIVKALRK